MQTSGQDNSEKEETIDLNNTADIDFWASQLGISGQRLIDAISVVGRNVKDLKEYLGG